MDIQLGTLTHVDPRTLWVSESGSFTPWLAAHLQLLGEALGLDLESVQTEAAVGDFACDIGARESLTNRPVIIENQLERTDHTHLGQLITYAAGLDAAVIVWISPEVRDEHRQALDWLNRHTDEDIDFFGVALELVQIDGSKPAVQFRPVAFPNAWSKKRQTTKPGTFSDRRLAYRNFHQPLLDELRDKHKFTNAKVAQPQNWYSFGSGITGIHYNANFAGGDRLRAELYIDIGDAAENKAVFDWLYARRIEIESKLGEPVDWERLDHRRASRISIVRPASSIDSPPADQEAMRGWLVEKLLKLKQVFGVLLPEAGSIEQESLLP